MDLWYSEMHTKNVKLSIKVDKQLYSGESDYQRIDVFESPEFGRFLTLDGYMMLTEKDEFIYHEMITHTAMAVHSHPENILVIGAGDGGVARELTKYPQVKSIDVVEIDEQVIQVCKKYMKQTACGFDDPRVNVLIQDGLKYLRKCDQQYDLIIVDSTDPFGPGECLFTKEFYGNCFKALKDDGIMLNQHESPFYEADALTMQSTHKRISSCFPVVKIYQAHIPTYPSGHWLFGFASKGLDPVKDLKAEQWNAMDIDTKYYNTDLHIGSFCLPNYVKQQLKK